MENIYTFVGEDTSYNLSNINNKINELNIPNSTIIKFDFEDSNINKLIEELNTISFFVENKIVILYNTSFMEIGNNISDSNEFLKYLSNPNPTTYLFISINNTEKLLKEYKDSITNNTIIVDSKILSPEEFNQYIKNKAKKNGYQIQNDAVEELIKRSEEDYNLLNSNFEKLLIYKFDSKNINLNDVYLMITKDLDQNVFDLVNAYISKDKRKTYEIYEDLKNSNSDDSSILGSLIFKFREMALTKKMVDSGMSKQDIANILNVKEGRAYYMIKNVESYSLNTLIDRLNDLLQLDYKSKVGLIDLDKALLTYLIK